VAGKTYTVNHILNTVFNLGYSTVVFDVGITVTVLLPTLRRHFSSVFQLVSLPEELVKVINHFS